jgi:hypothetical protein
VSAQLLFIELIPFCDFILRKAENGSIAFPIRGQEENKTESTRKCNYWEKWDVWHWIESILRWTETWWTVGCVLSSGSKCISTITYISSNMRRAIQKRSQTDLKQGWVAAIENTLRGRSLGTWKIEKEQKSKFDQQKWYHAAKITLWEAQRKQRWSRCFSYLSSVK